MSFKKISKISILVLTVFLVMTVVSAKSSMSINFVFPNSKTASVSGELTGGKIVGKASYNFQESHSVLNMTLQKNGLFGPTGPITRCWDLNTYRNTSSSCTFLNGADKGKYTSTLILNESDGGYLSGTYEVTSSNS